MSTQLARRYDPSSIETKWRRYWERERVFDVSDLSDEAYCIVLPPPNVTGTLHMGHAFQTTLIDTLIRYQRMCGKKVLWQGGADHAGIATQMVVERLLENELRSRRELGREQFIQRVWQWKQQSGGTINQQLRRLGCSIDWSRERFTMDEALSQAVSRAFCRLYHDGLIYRGQTLTNWDPHLQTVVSDLEVVYTEEPGKLYHIRYPVVGDDRAFVVATTRPETLFGDSAVAVHPNDERYRQLIGARAVVPLAGREIPIIADEAVDMEFGSGCLKITPAHDFNDFEIGKRHDLPALNIMDTHAHLNENVPVPFRGKERMQARAEVVDALGQQGLLVEVRDHQQRVPRGDRSHEIIEPMLTRQWFVDMSRHKNADGNAGGRDALVQPAIDAVRQGQIRFVPRHWENTYFRWMENLHDWCISRQIWWGHRIPAWYDEAGRVYVAENLQQVYEQYGLDSQTQLSQDEDVLDTWFSSALWPFSSLDWPHSDKILRDFYPTSVLVTGFDIIFFWVARMVMFGLYFQGKPPFRDIYIHGLIRDSHNQKMSKSRGNIIDPLDIIDGIESGALVAKRTSHLMQPQMRQRIEKATRREFPNGINAFGCDSLRFAFNALASSGRDIRLDMKRIESGRNFCNKLWNAARYLLMQEEKYPAAKLARERVASAVQAGQNGPMDSRHPCNRWIVSSLQTTIAEVHRHIAQYRFDLSAKVLYEFAWEYYCDWYLEISKFLIDTEKSGVDESVQSETLTCLYAVFESLIRLLHPLIPFISEEIHQQMFPQRASSLGLLACPQSKDSLQDPDSVELLRSIQGIVGAIRQARSVRTIAPGKTITAMLYHPRPDSLARIFVHEALMRYLAGLDRVRFLERAQPEQATSLHFCADLHIHLPLDSAQEIEAELRRLNRDLKNTHKRLSALEKRLADPGYTRNAPAEIVGRDRNELARLRGNQREIDAQIAHAQKNGGAPARQDGN